MLATLLKILIRIISGVIGGALVMLGTLGLMVVKDVFTNHLLLIVLSLLCLVAGVFVVWWGSKKW